MSVIFSRQCEYALQAVLYLALKPAESMTSIKDLSRTLKIPYHFLGKILQDLTRKGLLRSLKGPAGGFALKRSPGSITVLEIVVAIDGDGMFNRCVLGFPECSGKTPCAIHKRWGGLRSGLYAMLATKSIAELAGGMDKAAYVLARKKSIIRE
jgi:Rrf2 family protein